MSVPSLRRYLEIKVHHLIYERDWASIRVVGAYDRDCVVSANEKNDKLFNWQRPTAEVHGDDLIIKCFPGLDYVRHYALIIATYLSMAGRYRGQVDYELPGERRARRPSTGWTWTRPATISSSSAGGWGASPTAAWTTARYAWQRAEDQGRRVLYLGYLHSIWGDAAGRVVSRLAALGARRVVYIGKVGSLDPAIAPNTCLATGDSSVLADGPVTWRDFFAGLAAQPDVRPGVHVTSPSILLEDESWLARQRGSSSTPRSGTWDALRGRRHRVRVPPHHLQQPGRAPTRPTCPTSGSSPSSSAATGSSTASTRSSGSGCGPGHTLRGTLVNGEGPRQESSSPWPGSTAPGSRRWPPLCTQH